jgi:hypothetical protein
MSAAAGAPPPPPPPPPPPRHNSGFDDLPAELLLMLYQYIGLEQFMNLALVIYPTLMRHTMVPELTPRTFIRIVSDVDIERPSGKSNAWSAVTRMPVELWLHVAEYLEPVNSIALVFALGSQFWRFPGKPSEDLVMWLRIWSRRSRRK